MAGWLWTTTLAVVSASCVVACYVATVLLPGWWREVDGTEDGTDGTRL